MSHRIRFVPLELLPFCICDGWLQLSSQELLDAPPAVTPRYMIIFRTTTANYAAWLVEVRPQRVAHAMARVRIENHLVARMLAAGKPRIQGSGHPRRRPHPIIFSSQQQYGAGDLFDLNRGLRRCLLERAFINPTHCDIAKQKPDHMAEYFQAPRVVRRIGGRLAPPRPAAAR